MATEYALDRVFKVTTGKFLYNGGLTLISTYQDQAGSFARQSFSLPTPQGDVVINIESSHPARMTFEKVTCKNPIFPLLAEIKDRLSVLVDADLLNPQNAAIYRKRDVGKRTYFCLQILIVENEDFVTYMSIPLLPNVLRTSFLWARAQNTVMLLREYAAKRVGLVELTDDIVRAMDEVLFALLQWHEGTGAGASRSIPLGETLRLDMVLTPNTCSLDMRVDGKRDVNFSAQLQQSLEIIPDETVPVTHKTE